MYGFVYSFLWFVIAMVIITIGEMMTVPTSQALVANFAPEDMRGRYMAVYGLAWVVPSAFGPLLAGIVMDNGQANWVWWGGGILAMVAAFGFWWMHARVGKTININIADDIS